MSLSLDLSLCRARGLSLGAALSLLSLGARLCVLRLSVCLACVLRLSVLPTPPFYRHGACFCFLQAAAACFAYLASCHDLQAPHTCAHRGEKRVGKGEETRTDLETDLLAASPAVCLEEQ